MVYASAAPAATPMMVPILLLFPAGVPLLRVELLFTDLLDLFDDVCELGLRVPVSVLTGSTFAADFPVDLSVFDGRVGAAEAAGGGAALVALDEAVFPPVVLSATPSRHRRIDPFESELAAADPAASFAGASWVGSSPKHTSTWLLS